MRYPSTSPASRTGTFAAVAAIILAVPLSACSKGAEKAYSVPHIVCGTKVNADLMSPFLPPGKKISTQSLTPNDGTRRCRVIVDEKVALIFGQIWWGEKGSIADVASVHFRVTPENAAENGKYLYSETGAVAKTEECSTSKHPDQDLFTVIQVSAPDRENKSVMRRLIADYTENVEKSDACAGDTP
ncbi:hypothetical protein ACFY93_34210 [Streptomyces sp. NPDC008313]|uniref:hypothetical protein n=1 Tax=Streptomyces sp. NPDC008313 TaxID=3364826 RepID=UPI0036E3E64B